MKWFESVVAWLFPSVLIDGTAWKHIWEEKDRESFLLVAKVFFPLVAVTYIAHYFFYDLPNNLEPIESWLLYRVSMAGIAIVVFGFYLSPLANIRFYRAPAILACWGWCQSQAYVALWHGLEAWVFCYILIGLAAIPLRLSALNSAVFVLITVSTQAPILLQAGIPMTYIYTGSLVTTLFVLVVRSSYLSEVKTFLLNQENIATQKKIIELNMEFSERIRSFIPKIIAQRMEDYIERERMTVLEASIEVLTPRKVDVACLFSDIRGFTENSKALEEFVGKSVLPEVKACSDVIENYSGIPRKIGDLIFAYFDGAKIGGNLLRSVASGMEISRLNQDMNATSSSIAIKRYVLISCGEALVGNVGGLDSSIEITALGSPVNYLSRIDELTKHPGLASKLDPGDLILCERSGRLLGELTPGVCQNRIDLEGLTVRDFPEVGSIYSVKPTDSNFQAILEAFRAKREEGYGVSGSDRLCAA